MWEYAKAHPRAPECENASQSSSIWKLHESHPRVQFKYAFTGNLEDDRKKAVEYVRDGRPYHEIGQAFSEKHGGWKPGGSTIKHWKRAASQNRYLGYDRKGGRPRLINPGRYMELGASISQCLPLVRHYSVHRQHVHSSLSCTANQAW